MFTVRCIATAIFYYNHVRMLVFDGKAIAKDHSTKVWFKLAQWLQRS
jgi:hypothetical protein